MTSKSSRSVVYAWAAAIVAYTVLVPTEIVGAQFAAWIAGLAPVLAALLAALACLRAAKGTRARRRHAWLLFGAASVAWMAGQLIRSGSQLIRGTPLPVPSLGDLGYASFALIAIVGLFVLRAPQTERKLTWLRVANLALVLCSLAGMLVAMMAQPFAVAAHPPRALLALIAHNALLAIAFVVSIYILWSYRWRERLLSVVLLTASFALHMMCSFIVTRGIVSGSLELTAVVQVGWLVAFGLQYLAATEQTEAEASSGDRLQWVRAGEGWVEAFVPSVLILLIAVTGVLLTPEITPEVVLVVASMLGIFAVLLALRECWVFSRGMQLKARLDESGAQLDAAREQLTALESQRIDLERSMHLAARAGAVGLWDWDLLDDTVRYSREWKRQLGYGDSEIGNSLEEWRTRVHPADLDRVTRELQRFLDDPKQDFSSEVRLRHRDGSYRWILTRATLLMDGHGKPVRMRGSHVDITQRRQMEESLRESEARYRELADTLETHVLERTEALSDAYWESQSIAHAVAHDLRAPLRAIDAFTHLLAQSTAERLSDSERAYVDRVRRATLQMSALIDGLLEYSRIEHRELRVGDIDSDALVHELLCSLDEAIREKGAEIRVDCGGSHVWADRECLRIVLRNLLDNALKFSRTATMPRIEITCSRTADRGVLCVRDQGIGFDPAYKEKIFDIFQRLHRDEYQGIGIGLALARKAAQRMQGRIWAEAAPGQGAAFFVSLPAVRESTVVQ